VEGYELGLYLTKIRLRRCKLDLMGSEYGSIAENDGEHLGFIKIGNFLTG
jgi:hypothetical protein